MPSIVPALLSTAAFVALAAASPPPAATSCKSDMDCSLNGVCAAGACKCDAPWTGAECGVLGYKTTPVSGKSLYPESDLHNSWNGAIIRATDGVYHLYNPLYPAGSLGGATALKHGTAANITGPYTWGEQPDIAIPLLPEFDGPKSVTYTDKATNKTMYSLWLGSLVYTADSAAGPWTVVPGFSYSRGTGSRPGQNPAPMYHNGAFFDVSMGGIVYTTPALASGAVWTKYSAISDHGWMQPGVPPNWIPEDPDMWVDRRNNWHIINHAYNTYEWKSCGTSLLSSHFFSSDAGKTWHFLPQAIQPYGHTVQYDDGSSHMFVTLERPNVYLDEHGQLTHIHLAADLVTGDEGCGNRTEHAHHGHTPCDNCKFADHGGTTIIALDV